MARRESLEWRYLSSLHGSTLRCLTLFNEWVQHPCSLADGNDAVRIVMDAKTNRETCVREILGQIFASTGICVETKHQWNDARRRKLELELEQRQSKYVYLKKDDIEHTPEVGDRPLASYYT